MTEYQKIPKINEKESLTAYSLIVNYLNIDKNVLQGCSYSYQLLLKQVEKWVQGH